MVFFNTAVQIRASSKYTEECSMTYIGQHRTIGTLEVIEQHKGRQKQHFPVLFSVPVWEHLFKIKIKSWN